MNFTCERPCKLQGILVGKKEEFLAFEMVYNIVEHLEVTNKRGPKTLRNMTEATSYSRKSVRH